LKYFSISAFLRSRYLLAIVAGLLLAASFPNLGVAGFAWIAPGLMLAAALGKSGGESFRLGYVAGLAHYLGSLSWLLRIPYRWHGLPIGPAAGWMALSAFIALYPAVFVWLAIRISRFTDEVSGVRCQVSGEDGGSWLAGLRQVAGWSWARRTSWALACAAIWVALEMIVARFLGGFPWNLLGASQYRIVPLIQIASITGIYGVSFLVVWSSVSLLGAAAVIVGQSSLRSSWVREIFLPMAAVGVLFFFGFHRLSIATEGKRELKVALVQPSIPQTLIWNPDNNLDRFHELIRLSETALSNAPDVLIWPEAAMPGLPRYEKDLADPISELARAHKVWLIIGADDALVTDDTTNYFNASFLINPEGRLANSYRKRGLVIFGEYIPFERSLPFMKWFTPVGGSYTAGDAAVPFELNWDSDRDLRVMTSALICYEDVFPHLARASVEPDTDFLVNITNDGWFGEGAAQWQQAASAVFRAVENGVPLIRCANTGLTCWVDASGRIRQILVDANGSIYGAGFMTAKIPLLAPGQNRTSTIYHRHGDWFGWGCVVFAVVTLLREIARTWRSRSLR
jgi:apolipoprotein N-acyltransferase